MQPYENELIDEYKATINGTPITVEVRLKKYPDDYGDSGEFLGTFTDTYSDYAIDRRWELLGMDVPEPKEYENEDGEWVEEDPPEPPYYIGRDEYAYFLPSMPYVKGDDLDEYRKYALQDYERVMSLYRGDWCYIGIVAEAKLAREESHGLRFLAEVTSGGLWGIESDSGDEYIDEIVENELADLEEQLKSIGVVRVGGEDA